MVAVLPSKLSAAEIHDAAAHNDVKAVQRIIAADPSSVNQRDSKNYTPLHWAAVGGDYEICKTLVEAGAKPDESTDIQMSSGAFDAASAQGKKVNQLSTSNQASVANAAGLSGGYTPLLLAVDAGKIKVVEYLLSVKADPNKKDPLGQTALHTAITREHTDIALLLIGKGADVNAKDKDGLTPLHTASSQRLVNVVDSLLRAKANARAKGNGGETALLGAVEWGEGGAEGKPYPKEAAISICRMLAPVSDINAAYDFNGMTALMEATQFVQLEIAKILLDNKADPNVTEKTGSTALDVADLMVPATFDDDGKPTEKTKDAKAIQALIKKKGGKNKTPWNMGM